MALQQRPDDCPQIVSAESYVPPCRCATGKEEMCIRDRTAPGHYMARDRKGREIDIRPLILKADTNGKVVSLLLKNANDGALNRCV